jgi:GDP-L-fucose synthase
LLDVSRMLALGWRARTELRRGIEETYAWFLAHEQEILGRSTGARIDAGRSSLS